MKTEVQTAKDLALDTANTAIALASTAQKTAAELAAKTAETTTRIETNMVWMMKSLTNIEQTLGEMQKAFVTGAQHAEVCKRLDILESKTTALEFWRAALIASWGVVVVVASFLYFQLISPFIQEVVRHIQGK